jgi:alpha-galactosidase
MTTRIDHDLFTVTFPGEIGSLWIYHCKNSDQEYRLAAPVFEINGQPITAFTRQVELANPPQVLPNGCTEYRLHGIIEGWPHLNLEITLRTAPNDPVIRFRYRLLSSSTVFITKSEGKDNLQYTRVLLPASSQVWEITLSEFNELMHAYQLNERQIPAAAFKAGLHAAGPILAASDGQAACLLAYEHGSNLPNSYLAYQLADHPQQNVLSVNLQAVKGNYSHNQILAPEQPFETIWMQFAAVGGDLNTLAAAYRQFTLEHLSLYPATRQPLIFYNTWNFQERNRHWNHQPYLASMNAERILAEIDAAHEMGIDVFVLDTGWYSKTGDWEVDRTRFPDGLAPIRHKLEGYGMRLGLWFNPGAAAVSSHLHQAYRNCTIWRNGAESSPHPVWETEASRSFCLVSNYAEAFADQLIRLNRELGVTYFKWDAVGQENGCTSPDHSHGGIENPEQERAECYEFELVRALVRIAERVSAACPEAICDLDLTESGRSLGLAFLSAGKFFLINNGPYFANYDLPMPGTNENLFFNPGPARPTLCREALAYDHWIPSILFLTHYFPDETPQPEPHWSLPHGRADSLEVNLASLILGHNGIWGDLLSLSKQGIQQISETLRAYKLVAQAITRAAPVRTGKVGASPEIHEKLHQGQGAVVIFSPRRGVYQYVTQHSTAAPFWQSPGIEFLRTTSGKAVIQADFTRPGAKIVFFA